MEAGKVEKLSLKVASFKDINVDQAEEKTRSMLTYRIIDTVVFSLLALFMGNYIAGNWTEPHLAISGIIVGVFTLIALAGSIGQVTLLHQIDYAKPMVEIRKKIARVNSHGILFVKLVILSALVWWAYAILALDLFLGVDVSVYLEPNFVVRYVVVNLLLIIPIVWFFNKVSYQNPPVKWVRKTIHFLLEQKKESFSVFKRN